MTLFVEKLVALRIKSSKGYLIKINLFEKTKMMS